MREDIRSGRDRRIRVRATGGLDARHVRGAGPCTFRPRRSRPQTCAGGSPGRAAESHPSGPFRDAPAGDGVSRAVAVGRPRPLL